MAETPSTASASSEKDLVQRMLTEAFVIVDVTLKVGPGSKQLSWDALDFNTEQLQTLKESMAAKPPKVEPFPHLKKAGVRVKSAIEKFYRDLTIQSGHFKLYPQIDEERVAQRLFEIQAMAGSERAEMLEVRSQALLDWTDKVNDLLGKADIQDPEIEARLLNYFPSEERVARSLQVYWEVRVIQPLEDQAENSVKLARAAEENRELTIQQRLHQQAENQIREAVNDAADAAADEVASMFAELLGNLESGVKDKPLNGQRRQAIVKITDRLEALSTCFTGSDGVLEVAKDINAFVGQTKTYRVGSEEFQSELDRLRAKIQPEIKSLRDPSKKGHRSVGRFIQ